MVSEKDNPKSRRRWWPIGGLIYYVIVLLAPHLFYGVAADWLGEEPRAMKGMLKSYCYYFFALGYFVLLIRLIITENALQEIGKPVASKVD